jgi:ribose 5-phosphate isomerase A
MFSAEEIKKNTGIYAADFIEDKMTFGLGTGTTVYWLIEELGKRIRQGLQVTAVPTSHETAELGKQAGIIISDLSEIDSLPFTIDGADEIDPQGQLIKGGGGALLKEKIVAAASDELIIIADNSKLVQQLGKFPLPVEIVSFGYKQVTQKIKKTGFCKRTTLRKKNGYNFVTDLHHYILDCEFEKIEDASSINILLNNIPGVVETGLFINMASKAIIGYDDGNVRVITYR